MRVPLPGFIGGPLSIVLAYLIYSAIPYVAQIDADYKMEGQRTVATVTEKRTSFSSTQNRSLFVGYTFSVGEDHYQGHGLVGTDAYNSARVGGPIDIEYLRSRPAENRIVSSNDFPYTITLLYGFAAVLFVVGVLTLGASVVRFARRRL